MMKWKARTETTNIGVLELGNITLDEDYMEISIDICDMSEDLKAQLNKAIEIEKVRYSEEVKKDMESGISMVWSDKPVVMNYTYLRVRLEAGNRLITVLNSVSQMQRTNLRKRGAVVLRLIYRHTQTN